LQHNQISNQSRFSWGLEVIEQIYFAVGWNLLLHLEKRGLCFFLQILNIYLGVGGEEENNILIHAL
jgi:hypothetical protein